MNQYHNNHQGISELILLLGQNHEAVHVEQPLPPQLFLWWLRYALQSLQMLVRLPIAMAVAILRCTSRLRLRYLRLLRYVWCLRKLRLRRASLHRQAIVYW